MNKKREVFMRLNFAILLVGTMGMTFLKIWILLTQ